MRSSIACARCRRSKIKCVNAGIDTTCRACESSCRECVYPTPAIGSSAAAASNHATASHPAPKRDLAAASGHDGDDRNGEWDGPKRQRNSRKAINSAMSALSKEAMVKQSVLVALDPTVLTSKVWENLFEIFQQHFATLLPFVHPATTLSQIRQLASSSTTTSGNPFSSTAGPSADQSNSRNSTSRAEVSPLILLGVLTLTARFHTHLVQYHAHSAPSGTTDHATFASEFYANVLRARLSGADGADVTAADINRVQALLMLTVHEWGMYRGVNAWMYAGMASRIAQSLGLYFESDEDAYTSSLFSSRRPSTHGEYDQQPKDVTNNHVAPVKDRHNADDVIEQETKRRTFWSCFILDRCLSGGRQRPRMLRVRDVEIQLPSDNAFAFGERVRTSKLTDSGSTRSPRPQSYDSRATLNNNTIPGLRQSMGYSDDMKLRNGTDSKQWSTPNHRNDGPEDRIDRWEVGAEESVLARLIRIIRIWGSISEWTCNGGRKSDKYPSWHPESRFCRFRDLLAEFNDGLSRNLQYSPRNTDTHIMYKNNLAPYGLMHIVYFLSVIVLHRPDLPFLPLRTMDINGPVEDPSLPPETHQATAKFWKEGAQELFRASRQMTELIRTCHDRGVLMETPIVGFALYNAVLMGNYALYFPFMDKDGFMSSNANLDAPAFARGQADTRRAIEILADMRPRLKMATGWFRTIHRFHVYACRARKDHKRMLRRPEMTAPLATAGAYPYSPSSSRDTGVANINERGGSVLGHVYEDFKLLDKLLLELGSTEDQPAEMCGSDDEVIAMLSVNMVEHGTANGHSNGNASETGSNAVNSESGDAFDSHAENHINGVGVGGTRRESWVPVNNNNNHNSNNGTTNNHNSSPIRGLVTPHSSSPRSLAVPATTTTTGRENGEKIDPDRWTILPAPQPNATATTSAPSAFSLSAFHTSSYRDIPGAPIAATGSPPGSAGLPTPLQLPAVPPNSSISVPASTAASTTPNATTATAGVHGSYHPNATPPPSRLQNLPPYPTTLHPPPTGYAQALPSLNTPGQQPYSLPSLSQPHANGNNLTPPPHHSSGLNGYRPAPLQSLPPRYYSAAPSAGRYAYTAPSLPVDNLSSHPALQYNFTGDDVIAFVQGDSYDKWVPNFPQPDGPTSGWLGLVWNESIN
ncbi:hypothetical protein FQN57_002051 [Myotisia sp. PD_48]|nr:hypothetical protein FQN57_002051 [Myotisia sp. PD_48]